MKKLNVFISYSHKDEAFKEALDTHLSVLKHSDKIATWNDRSILAGTEWGNEIKQQLTDAHIIVLLVSASFLASKYIWKEELSHAMQRHENGTASIIPVFIRHCDWKDAPFGKIQGLPRDAQPVGTADNDTAWTEVAKGIRTVVDKVLEKGLGVTVSNKQNDNAHNPNTTQGNGNIVTENPTPPPKATCQTVLFMCASPSDVANVLNFGAEFEKIKQALITSPNRDKFDIRIETGVKYDNIQRLLLLHKPSILHISMHNSLADGFLFEKADGTRIALSDQQLSSMIKIGTKKHLPNLIVLSACNSKTHADAVKPYTTHLIAMNDFISDEAAAYYASEFYKIFFDTEDIETAHEVAINNLEANKSLTDNQKSALIPYIAK